MARLDIDSIYARCIEEAKKSPCVRRKFGAGVVYESIVLGGPINYSLNMDFAHNQRVSRCCNGDICARDRFNVRNGERIEVGAENHAEAGALILRQRADRNLALVLAGLDSSGKEMTAPYNYPCHNCAKMIKFAGFKYVYLKIEESVIEAISIEDILEHREMEWETE